MGRQRLDAPGYDWPRATPWPGSGPAPRGGHGLAYDARRGVVVLFGGSTDAGDNGETWEWDGNNWTLRATVGPLPRRHPRLAYDAARSVTVLFGGFHDGVGPLGDTWVWNGSAWALVATTGPSARFADDMVYDAVREQVVLFGGGDGTTWTAETWLWDGNIWTLQGTQGPAPRGAHTLAYDPSRGVIVLFGGWNPPEQYRDTWEATDLQIRQQPANQEVPVPQPALLTVQASGSGELRYRGRKNGTALDDNGRISGTATTTLSLNPTWMSDSGSYDVVVSDDCGSLTSTPATLTVSGQKGDLNCDGAVNFADIDPFVLALTTHSQYVIQYPNCDWMLADCNNDGYVDFADIDPFVALLSGG